MQQPFQTFIIYLFCYVVKKFDFSCKTDCHSAQIDSIQSS